MSGAVSIELLLDAESEAHVSEDWERLARAGHSSLGAHRAPSARPHVTLLVRPELATTSFKEALALLPLPITLGEPVTFDHGDRVVLARPVLRSDALLALYRSVHDAAGAGEDAAHTAPGDWSPHVTLARRLRRESLTAALALLAPAHAGSGVALRRWDSDTRTVTML